MTKGPESARRETRPLWVIGAGLVLIVVAIALALRPPSVPEATPTALPANPEGVPRVGPADARAALDSGRAVFLDVRSSGDYDASHIAGAVSIPLNELPDRFEELDPGDWIITYCT